MPKVNMKQLQREQEFVEDQECILDQTRYQACKGCGKRFCVKCDSASYPFPKEGEVQCLDCRERDRADELFRGAVMNAEVAEEEIRSGNSVSFAEEFPQEFQEEFEDFA